MRGQRGFTLVEMVVVIAVLGVLFTILIGITRVVVSQQRYQTTRARMANLDNALTVYVSQYRRLPCPADGALASSDPNAGLELPPSGIPITCPNNQARGVVPWRALGLTPSDAEDGWGGRFTYRVGPDLVADNSMDLTACDPAGTNTTVIAAPPYCNSACSSANLANCTAPATALTPGTSTGRGLVIHSVATATLGQPPLMDPRGNSGTGPSTGAAYALVSHGPEGGGAYSGDGVLTSSTVAPGTMEANNFADRAWVKPPASPGAPTVYLVDDVVNATATVSHFDDIVSRPGILALAIKAGIGPRAH